MQIGNILFLDTGSFTSQGGDSSTYIMYDNLLKDATVLQGGDVAPLYDNLTNIFYNLPVGTSEIEFEFNEAKTINCFALANCNLADANNSMLFYLWDADLSEYYLIVNIQGGRNQQPVMVTFENQISLKAKVVISNSAVLQIGELSIGEALKMPVCPAVGYEPARWSSEDTITLQNTEDNNIGRSTILKRGNREVLPFELVPHTFMREVWANFIDNAKGLPIWISWNQENFPTECIYGMWSQNKPRYVSPLFSSIQLTVIGQA